MSKKVLIVGCGQLGSRHAQALAGAGLINAITVVDPSPEALALGHSRVHEIAGAKTITWQWCTALEQAKGPFDAAVVATQAPGRVELIKTLVRAFGIKLLLVEKIVAQSTKDYTDLMAFAREEHARIWVNCKSRAYQVHQYIKTKLLADEPILYTASGGNHGLGNNGVHHADLFIFFDGARSIEPFGSYIDPVLHASKRGSHIMDLSGTLCGKTSKGSQLTISFAAGHMGPDQIFIAGSKSRFMVDHLQRTAFESHESEKWAWKPLAWNEDILVSCMTKQFMKDILERRACLLPDLEQCYPAHEFILGQLQPAFQALGKSADLCPVT